MKCIPAVNSVNKTNRNRYNSVLKISCKIFYCQLKQLLFLTLYIIYSYSCSCALRSVRSQLACSAKNLDSRDFSLPCRPANDFRLAANDFTVSHGNKIYIVRLKKFSLQKKIFRVQ
jgi:hypothetical protein